MPDTAPAVLPNRWMILAATSAVLMMTPLDSSAVAIIIPIIQADYAISLGQVAWVALVYLVIITSLILPIGRLGDIVGFRCLYLLGVAVFTGASLLCGLAPGPGWLIGARAVQGVGAALMMALSPGIATALFPPWERGRALGFTGMAIAAGLVLGPTVGGVLAYQFGWRWIFFINLPIGIIGGWLCWRLLPPLAPTARHAVDWVGGAVSMIGLAALMLALTQGNSWGWTSVRVFGLVSVFMLCAVIFIIVERRHPSPMLDFTLFANPVFRGANVATVLNYLGQFSALFLTPLLLQQGFGYSAQRTGLTMAALPLMVLIIAPFSGARSDRTGTRALTVAGELLVAVGLVALALVITRGQWWAIVAALALVGTGTGIFQSPNNNAIMSSVPRAALGIGGGVLATMRNLGMTLGVAVSSVVVAIATQPISTPATLISGVRTGYLVGALFLLLGAIASALRQDTAQR